MPRLEINRSRLNVKLGSLARAIRPEPLLKIAAEVMRGEINKTFAEEGHPARSWKPLAPSTQRRRRNKTRTGTKILQDTGRLRNSPTYEIAGNKLTIGPSRDIPYAEIHQRGGEAGRRPPFKKKGGRRPFIPARPYIVVRKETPTRLKLAFTKYIQQQIAKEGLSK